MKEIDVRGMFCPTPLTFISREMKNVKIGESVKVIANSKGFDRDIKIWCHDTGNKLEDLQKLDNDTYVAIIKRGKGWHGDTLWEKLKFYAIGVKLHLIMYILEIFSTKKPRYLITFISIPEGFRAIEFLEKKGIKNFITLPVPNEIYEFCGVVIGFKDKNETIKVYNLLKDEGFGVENIHIVDKNKKYPVLEVSL